MKVLVIEIKHYQLNNTLVKGIINNLEKSDICKTQWVIAINFISSKNTDEECGMHSKSDKTEITTYYEANEIIKKLFQSAFLDIKSGWKHHSKGVILSLIVFIYCITNDIK